MTFPAIIPAKRFSDVEAVGHKTGGSKNFRIWPASMSPDRQVNYSFSATSRGRAARLVEEISEVDSSFHPALGNGDCKLGRVGLRKDIAGHCIPAVFLRALRPSPLRDLSSPGRVYLIDTMSFIFALILPWPRSGPMSD